MKFSKIVNPRLLWLLLTTFVFLSLQSGRASLGEDLYKILSVESNAPEETLNSLNLKSEHEVLEAVNRLEAAVFAWKVKTTEQVSGKSPVRTSWSFLKDPISEMDKMELLFDRAEALLHQLKTSYPNLPHTFLDVTKIQYGKVSYHALNPCGTNS